MIYSAATLQSSFLQWATHFGNQILGIYLPPCKLATSASFAKADSTVSSMFYFPRIIHPMKILVFQNITNSSRSA